MRGLNRERAPAYRHRLLARQARGLTDRAIAERLGIGTRTVHEHLENVYEKLGVGTHADALALLGGDEPSS